MIEQVLTTVGKGQTKRPNYDSSKAAVQIFEVGVLITIEAKDSPDNGDESKETTGAQPPRGFARTKENSQSSGKPRKEIV